MRKSLRGSHVKFMKNFYRRNHHTLIPGECKEKPFDEIEGFLNHVKFLLHSYSHSESAHFAQKDLQS